MADTADAKASATATARKTPKVDGCALCEEYLCCPEHCCDWDDCDCTDCANCGAKGLAFSRSPSPDRERPSVGVDENVGPFATLLGDLPPASPKTPPKHTAYVINGLETNIAAGSGLRCIRWLAHNDTCT